MNNKVCFNAISSLNWKTSFQLAQQSKGNLGVPDTYFKLLCF